LSVPVKVIFFVDRFVFEMTSDVASGVGR